ncbi:hypothetical protein PV11_00796 [Exophiala sideris]|uniref:Uncharacterized protein n=1 Tax=Exophiala sideris TaxID=1016849 RepID=A0A0D1W8K9_9EURO|nr:hypothetical protein PV11_00796 [Exophiala sideris]
MSAAVSAQVKPALETTVLDDSSPIADPSTPNARSWPNPEEKARSKRSRFFRTIQRYVWDDPDKPKEEKWFLFKLDIFRLTISCLGYFSKNLDQANINNAYVSGMKEALHMNGNQLTYAGNVFTAGYVLGQQSFLPRVYDPPSFPDHGDFMVHIHLLLSCCQDFIPTLRHAFPDCDLRGDLFSNRDLPPWVVVYQE